MPHRLPAPTTSFMLLALCGAMAQCVGESDHPVTGDNNIGPGVGDGGDGDGDGDTADGDGSNPGDDDDAGDDDDDDPGDDDDNPGDDDDDDDDDPGAKFDIGDPEEGDPDDGDEEPITYIWIANSPDSTVSKIDTRSMIEEGRYITRPDKLGNPSRTSVGMGGNVAVANRHGGVVKIHAIVDDCEDKNGNGAIETAVGDAYLPWDQEECVAWYTEMAYGSQRSIAWTVELDTDGDVISEKVWVTGTNGGGTNTDVFLLDGDTGAIDRQTQVNMQGKGTHPYAAYGGAVDGENNLWFSGNTANNWLVRVSYADLAVKIWDRPYAAYGMTVDADGKVWVCGDGTARFDPATETFAQVTFPAGDQGLHGGCMADAEGRLWMDIKSAGGIAMAAIDIETLEVVEKIPIAAHTHGVSIDFDGNVWGVVLNGTDAYRIDPVSGTIDTFSGLVSAYTYSDMTGFALANVQDPPEG